MNTNPAAHRILCLGDSNTWGYIPGSSHERYPADIRWPGALQNRLGLGYEVIEEGLNSRTIESPDNRPGKTGRTAMEYLVPCLDSHDPLDTVIVMLGTNELKAAFGLSSVEIGAYMDVLVDIVLTKKYPAAKKAPRLVLVAPPLVDEQADHASGDGKYAGAEEKSRELGEIYAHIARSRGCLFLDAGSITVVGSDGIHMTATGHPQLAEALAGILSA